MSNSFTLQKKIMNKTPFFYGWVMVFIAALTMFFTSPGQTFSFSIFIDQFIKEFGWTRSQVNNYYSLATLLSGSTMFMIGKYIDRYGTKKIVIISSVLLAGSMAFLSFMTGSLVMLFIGFFLGRFSGQGVLGLSSGVIAPHWFIKKRGFAIMLAGLGGTIGAAILPKLNLFLINTYGWRMAFRILGASVILICVPICLILFINKPEDVGKYPDDTKEHPDDENDLKAIIDDEKTSLTQAEVLKTGTFWIFFLAAAQVSMIVTGSTLNMLSIFRVGGLSDSFATTIMSLSSIIGLIANIVVGIFIDKIKKPQIVLAIMCFMQAGSYVILSAMNTQAEAIVYVALIGIAMATFQLSHKLVLPMFFGRRYLGGVSGLMTIAWVGGSALGPAVFGNAYEYFGGYKEVLLILALVPIVTGIALFFTRIPQKRRTLTK